MVKISSKIVLATKKLRCGRGKLERQEIRFFGNVQGVGFRYTAKYAARALGLTGWVYNDYDGSVLMEVQGNPETIERLINKIEERPFIIIENMDIKKIPLVAGEGDFDIRDSF